MEKEVEQHILKKCSKCNIFQVIRDLLPEFMNLNALKIILKIHKKTSILTHAFISRRIN